jgi:hypothetical protein
MGRNFLGLGCGQDETHGTGRDFRRRLQHFRSIDRGAAFLSRLFLTQIGRLRQFYRNHGIDTPGTLHVRRDMAKDTARYEAILAEHGAEFRGIQSGPAETLILFVDPNFRATLAVTESQFSFDTVSQRLEESRKAYLFDSTVQKSLC